MPLRTAPEERSGHTVHIHTETIDTGERKDLFGYIARRVITKNTQTRDSQRVSESGCDGWYIDPPAAWLYLHPPEPGIHYVAVGTGKRDGFQFSEVGSRETVFLLLATRTDRSFSRGETGNRRVHKTINHEEITAISEMPPAADLFVPPTNFKRVTQLPDEHYALSFRLRLREMLQDAFFLPKRIAKFTNAVPGSAADMD